MIQNVEMHSLMVLIWTYIHICPILHLGQIVNPGILQDRVARTNTEVYGFPYLQLAVLFPLVQFMSYI